MKVAASTRDVTSMQRLARAFNRVSHGAASIAVGPSEDGRRFDLLIERPFAIDHRAAPVRKLPGVSRGTLDAIAVVLEALAEVER